MFESIYAELLNKLQDQNEVALLTYLDRTNEYGKILSKVVISSIDSVEDSLIKEAIEKSFKKGIPSKIELENKNILIEPFFPKPRLIILGGGHIAKPLSEFGHKVGFSITVADDRPFFANHDRFSNADEVILKDFNSIIDSLNIRNSDFIVIVTRGHRYDGICLRNALKFTPAYIGMIGSRRRVKAMMDLLISEGYDKNQLDKVCSPIGLDIGAVTPEEIGISIIEQVISYRRNINKKNLKYSDFSWPDFDMDVIKEASKTSKIPRALITIIGSKGSVPRKAGAKMIAWLDGRLIGSIGGGCSEANILTMARTVINNKGYKIEHIDMTGDLAEDEGMVCGGTMEVIIESID